MEIADVSGEVFEQWYDSFSMEAFIDGQYASPTDTDNEILAMLAFHAVMEFAVQNNKKVRRYDIKSVFEQEWWGSLRAQARLSLDVFQIRGLLATDYQDVDISDDQS